MADPKVLREKLRKIEVLFAGAATAGEKLAAGAAAERIRARLKDLDRAESPVEIRFSLADAWSQQLFIALCRRYGLRPYRYPRMRRQTVVVRAPKSFLEKVLWPEFQQINAALTEYLNEVTEKIIRDEVGDTKDAEEIQEPGLLGQRL